MTRRPPPCGDLGLPHAFKPTRRFVIGWRCERHTPNAVRGLPEPPPGPGWPPGNYLNQRDHTEPEPLAEQEPS